jgi:hypothetical protein
MPSGLRRHRQLMVSHPIVVSDPDGLVVRIVDALPVSAAGVSLITPGLPGDDDVSVPAPVAHVAMRRRSSRVARDMT